MAEMRETIKNFAEQFKYEPEISGRLQIEGIKTFIVVGMGGSHLAADILNNYDPTFNIIIHKNYGLPALPSDVLRNSLIIANSYSGNTEEVLDAFNSALERKLNLAAISVSGKLLELSRKHKVPFIQMPDTGIQPRSALGFQAKALLKMMAKEKELAEITQLAELLKPEDFETQGKELAERIKDKVPVIYTSEANYAIAYNWKIKFNETGKIPAFYNVFPELNHNEMTGFDIKDSSRHLSQNFTFFLLTDKDDHPQIQKRMEILKKLYKDRGLQIEVLELTGKNKFHKIFSSLVLADWIAYYTAKQYNLEPEKVPMIEEFKKLIQ
jgi:glucose/mannose-6-phosphate isomerase